MTAFGVHFRITLKLSLPGEDPVIDADGYTLAEPCDAPDAFERAIREQGDALKRRMHLQNDQRCLAELQRMGAFDGKGPSR